MFLVLDLQVRYLHHDVPDRVENGEGDRRHQVDVRGVLRVNLRVQRVDDRKANREVVALRAENREDAGLAEVQRTDDQQADEQHREERDGLGDEDGEEEAPVDSPQIDLRQRQKNQRWQGKRADVSVKPSGTSIRNYVEAGGDVAEFDKGIKKNYESHDKDVELF